MCDAYRLLSLACWFVSQPVSQHVYAYYSFAWASALGILGGWHAYKTAVRPIPGGPHTSSRRWRGKLHGNKRLEALGPRCRLRWDLLLLGVMDAHMPTAARLSGRERTPGAWLA